MLPFLRSDLAQLTAYTPHPGGVVSSAAPSEPEQPKPHLDRLDTNENPFDLPDELKQKVAWLFQQTIESNRYPDGSHADLKAAIASYVTESAFLPPDQITPSHLSVSNGSDELIRSLLIATCLGGEGAILVAQPTFSMYGILAQTLGIPVVTVDRSEASFEINLTAAQAALEENQNPPIRAVFVVHPNSPTGNMLTDAELAWLRSLPNHILVVIDEAYFEFSQQSLVAEIQQRSNWVVLRTFSKAFRLAGHRVGYAIAHPELIAALEKVRLPYNLSSFSLAATQLVLSHRQMLLAVIPVLLAEREKLFRALSAMPQLRVWPSSANFIFIRPENGFALADGSAPADSATRLDRLFQYLKEQGTLIRKINNGFRVTVGSPAENQRTLERLQMALEHHS